MRVRPTHVTCLCALQPRGWLSTVIDLCGSFRPPSPWGAFQAKLSSSPFSSLAELESPAPLLDWAETQKRQLCALLPALMDFMAFKGTKPSLSFIHLTPFRKRAVLIYSLRFGKRAHCFSSSSGEEAAGLTVTGGGRARRPGVPASVALSGHPGKQRDGAGQSRGAAGG